MAYPVAKSFAAASGQTIRAPARPLAGLTGDVMVAGDSLTDISYSSSGYRMGFPLTLHPPRVVFNAGWQGQTISDLADRLQSHITAYPSANTIVIRIGTNGPGGSGVYQTEYARLFAILSSNGKKGVFHYATPRNVTGGVNPFVAQNAWLQAQCDANPAYLAFIPDSQDLLDANGNVISSYTIGDGIHMNGKGVYAQAKRMLPYYNTIFAATEARLTDPADKYPSNGSSNQYVQNPYMTGTGGTPSSGVTGTLPNNWTAYAYGASTAVASVTAADTGEEAFGQRIQLTSMVSGGNTNAFYIETALQHPAIAADATIKRLDVVAEIDLIGLDCTAVDYLQLFPNVGGTQAGSGTKINLSGIVGTITEKLVFRTSLPRTQDVNAGNSAALVAYSANTLKLSIILAFNGAGSVPGTIKISCVSVRGSTT